MARCTQSALTCVHRLPTGRFGIAVRHDAPAELREGMEDNLRTLVVEHLAAINLRLMTKAAPDDRFLGPRAESFCLPRDEP